MILTLIKNYAKFALTLNLTMFVRSAVKKWKENQKGKFSNKNCVQFAARRTRKMIKTAFLT